MAKTDCSSILKVLADPTRLRIVEELMKGPKHVGEINKKIRIDQNLLSHHLKVLRASDLVRSERDGKAVLYRITTKVRGSKRAKALDLGCCRLSFD